MTITNKSITGSCKLIRESFHPSIILDGFKDVSGDTNLNNFPEMKELECKIIDQTILKINNKSLKEMETYFQENNDQFLDFLTNLIRIGLKSQFITKIAIDSFLVDVNRFLIQDSRVKIENYRSIMLFLPNKSNKEIFMNRNTPDIVIDYFSEALECFANELHRSSILFCTYALEASLRIKYAEIVDKRKAYKIYFSDLIKWAKTQKLIEKGKFYSSNINFLREYRNDLAHLNLNKDSREVITRGYAGKMSDTIISMVKLFINNIFTEV